MRTKHHGRPAFRPKTTIIGTFNAEGQQNRIPSIKRMLETNNTLPTQSYIDILGCTETLENLNTSNYETIKKYTWIGKPYNKPPYKWGIGFWIKNSIKKHITTVSPTINNDHILWIQYLSSAGPLYIAVVYIRPNDPAESKKTYDALKENFAQFSEAGTPILIGDFNSHYPSITGDKQDRPVNKNDKEFIKLINNNKLHIPTNHKQQANSTHWTYISKNGRLSKSIVDYIITPQCMKPTEYTNHRQATCGSSHSLITAKIPASPSSDTVQWEPDHRPKCIWDEGTINLYQENINKELEQINEPEIKNTEDLLKYHDSLIKIINKHLPRIKHTGNKRRESSTNRRISLPIKIIENKNLSIIKKLKQINKNDINTQNKLWALLHQNQMDILSILNNQRATHDKYVWSQIGKAKHEGTAKEYLKKLKATRGNQSTSTFPGYLADGDKLYTTNKKQFSIILTNITQV